MVLVLEKSELSPGRVCVRISCFSRRYWVWRLNELWKARRRTLCTWGKEVQFLAFQHFALQHIPKHNKRPDGTTFIVEPSGRLVLYFAVLSLYSRNLSVLLLLFSSMVDQNRKQAPNHRIYRWPKACLKRTIYNLTSAWLPPHTRRKKDFMLIAT